MTTPTSAETLLKKLVKIKTMFLSPSLEESITLPTYRKTISKQISKTIALASSAEVCDMSLDKWASFLKFCIQEGIPLMDIINQLHQKMCSDDFLALATADIEDYEIDLWRLGIRARANHESVYAFAKHLPINHLTQTLEEHYNNLMSIDDDYKEEYEAVLSAVGYRLLEIATNTNEYDTHTEIGYFKSDIQKLLSFLKRNQKSVKPLTPKFHRIYPNTEECETKKQQWLALFYEDPNSLISCYLHNTYKTEAKNMSFWQTELSEQLEFIVGTQYRKTDKYYTLKEIDPHSSPIPTSLLERLWEARDQDDTMATASPGEAASAAAAALPVPT